jgi:thymidylate synthase
MGAIFGMEMLIEIFVKHYKFLMITRKLKRNLLKKLKLKDEFAKKWGELGPIYGYQWRSWGKESSYMVLDMIN